MAQWTADRCFHGRRRAINALVYACFRLYAIEIPYRCVEQKRGPVDHAEQERRRMLKASLRFRPARADTIDRLGQLEASASAREERIVQKHRTLFVVAGLALGVVGTFGATDEDLVRWLHVLALGLLTLSVVLAFESDCVTESMTLSLEAGDVEKPAARARQQLLIDRAMVAQDINDRCRYLTDLYRVARLPLGLGLLLSAVVGAARLLEAEQGPRPLAHGFPQSNADLGLGVEREWACDWSNEEINSDDDTGLLLPRFQLEQSIDKEERYSESRQRGATPSPESSTAETRSFLRSTIWVWIQAVRRFVLGGERAAK